MPGQMDPEMAERFSAGFWDERYRSQSRLWSGKPNPYLVSEVSGLEPGAALDVGCGEGADAIWLAGQGWEVTGADISAVALDRAREHADEAGPGIAARIRWLATDMLRWIPDPEAYDLVTAHYVHVPPAVREELFGRMAAAVRPGGTLLIVGHHPSDLESGVPRPNLPELFFTGDDLVKLVDGSWEIVTNAAPGREATLPEGQTVTVHDTVFRARRRD